MNVRNIACGFIRYKVGKCNGHCIVKSVWNIGNPLPEVRWHNNMVYHKDYTPRCSFIFWVVRKDKMRTDDRLLRWGKVNNSTCVICGNDAENWFIPWIVPRILNSCSSKILMFGMEF